MGTAGPALSETWVGVGHSEPTPWEPTPQGANPGSLGRAPEPRVSYRLLPCFSPVPLLREELPPASTTTRKHGLSYERVPSTLGNNRGVGTRDTGWHSGAWTFLPVSGASVRGVPLLSLCKFNASGEDPGGKGTSLLTFVVSASGAEVISLGLRESAERRLVNLITAHHFGFLGGVVLWLPSHPPCCGAKDFSLKVGTASCFPLLPHPCCEPLPPVVMATRELGF